jgi:hypothetical protein
MTIRYDFDTTGFEPLNGKNPYALLDQHHDGAYVALQVPDSPLDRAGVWNLQWRRLEWEPSDTVALCWLHEGREAGLIRFLYQHDPRRHSGKVVIASPLQAEHTWSFERWSWPDKQRLRSIRIACPTGWFTNVVESPDQRSVAASWMEQDCAGVELIELDRYGDRQLVGQGLRVDTNWVTCPLFSPDGRLLLVSCGRGDPWWAPPAHDEYTPSPGGTFDFGEVVVYDLKSQTKQEIAVPVTVPQGWLPRQPWSPKDYLLDEGRFVGNREIELELPTGEAVRLQVGGDEAD